MSIGSVDPNFLLGSKLSQEEYIWYNCQSDPFEIRGLEQHEGETFRRVPEELAKRVSEGVLFLSAHTAGGRVRFSTDSSKIAVRVQSLGPFLMPHMPLTGISGVDIYLNGVFTGGVRPDNPNGGWFEGFVQNKAGQAEVEINLPLYNGVKTVLIGIDKGASVGKPRAYKYDKPVVYYGSSITQGGCASRPGNSYQGFLSRWLDTDHINLGFSGNGKGEPLMAEFIAKHEMSAFVMDYDHNAPNPEHLGNTHENFFRIIRKAHPSLPVIFVSKPDIGKNPEDEEARREIIRKTYHNALLSGDRNVWFVDGGKLLGKDYDACTVDTSHPNDLGFYRMAEGIYPFLKAALEKSGK